MPEGPSPVSRTPSSRTLAWAPAPVQTTCRPILPLAQPRPDRADTSGRHPMPFCSPWHMATEECCIGHLWEVFVGPPIHVFQAKCALRQVLDEKEGPADEGMKTLQTISRLAGSYALEVAGRVSGAGAAGGRAGSTDPGCPTAAGAAEVPNCTLVLKVWLVGSPVVAGTAPLHAHQHGRCIRG